MSKTLYLVASVPTQQLAPCRAEDLYTSHWFTMAKAYVSNLVSGEDAWVILSAKYGVIDPSSEVKPYDESQISRNRQKRQSWNRKIVSDLLQRTEPGDTIVALAGQRQRENLVGPLTAAQRNVEIPMADLRISQQKAWMRTRLEEAGVAQPEEEAGVAQPEEEAGVAQPEEEAEVVPPEEEAEVSPRKRRAGRSSSNLISEASGFGGGPVKSR